MASAIFIINPKGEPVISRHFRYTYNVNGSFLCLPFGCRTDISKTAVDAFRNKVRYVDIYMFSPYNKF